MENFNMSAGTSQSKKQLSLKREKNTNDKNAENSMANKCAKTDTTEVTKNNAFTKACMQVSYEASQDIKKRFQLLYLPVCKDRACNHGDKNINIKQISHAVEQSFKIEAQSNSWYEALEVCYWCINPCQYLSADILKDIVEIILNAQEDVNSGYAIDYILRKSQQGLEFQFNMHPPCVLKQIRDCYKDFLTSPMNLKDGTLSNRDQYLCSEGIVSHCIDRLIYEISIDSKDDILIDVKVPEDIKDDIRILHWKKENTEIFECLTRKERIERLMLVLKIIIDLLQTDLALWNSRSTLDSQMKSETPLLAYIIWPHIHTKGKVTDICRNIIELFAYFIHLEYPEEHIKVMSTWVNTVIQMFYIYRNPNNMDYPNANDSYLSNTLSLEINHILSSLPMKSVLKILERIQPDFMRSIVGVDLIQRNYKLENINIMGIINSCVKEATWKEYSSEGSSITLPTFTTQIQVKPNQLLKFMTERCKAYAQKANAEKTNSGKEINNPYPKLELKENNIEPQKSDFINILFITLVAYLEAYDIKKFQETYQYLELESDTQCVKECTSTYNSYTVSPEFVKNYQTIVNSLQELIKTLENNSDELSVKLLNLLKSYCN